MANTPPTSTQFPLTAPDVVYVDDLDRLATETTSEVQNLSQDLYHSLEMLPDSNPDVPGRGVGVVLYLSGSSEDLAGLVGAIEADFQKDFRVQACAATLSQEPDGSWLIQVEVEAIVGVFTLSFRYSQGAG